MQTQVKPKFMQNQLKDDEIGSEISFKSDRHGRAKLQSKYEDNLASYYDLCRKNIHSSNIKEKTSTKE